MSKKLLVMLTAMGTLSVTLVAAPIVKNVTAKIDPSISFNLNGEAVMKDSKALMYNDTLYLPVRALGDTLDASIDYKDKVVYITTEAQENAEVASQTEPTTKEVPAEAEAITIKEATIKAIDLEAKQVSILPAGLEDVYTNYIVLSVDDNTTLADNDAAIKLEDLATDMKVSVSHSTMMTRSLPPQTAAFNINVLAESPAPLENVTLEDVQIVEVNKTDFGYDVVVGNNASPEDYLRQTIIHINEDTVIRHEKNKRIYTAADLEKGMKVKVVHSPIMTLSLPGQTVGFEIIILAE